MDDLDRLLNARKTVDAPSNLSSRIYDTAMRKSGARKAIGFWEEFSMMFAIPRPAYVFAGVAILALLLGAQMSDLYSVTDTSDMIYYGEYDAGDWL